MKSLHIQLLAILMTTISAIPAMAQTKIDEMSLDRWAKLREVERYQLNIAEKYFKEKKYDVALSEYEKYLSLYERSDAASFAQLKWSLCLNQLRKQNTAIKEGFQSVIDYWPDSVDAAKASYLIGKTYVDIGRVSYGKKAYQETIENYPDNPVAVYSLSGLAEIARQEKNETNLVKIWKRLAFDIQRTKLTSGTCAAAANSLAGYYFGKGVFPDALKSLQANYKDDQLRYYVYYYVRTPLNSLIGDDETKMTGFRLADQVVSYLKTHLETDLSTDDLKSKAQQQWNQMIEVEKYSRRDEKVLAAYKAMLGVFGNIDQILGSLADYHLSQKRYDQARSIYRQFKDRIQGLSKVAASYSSEGNVGEAVKIYKQLAGLDAENSAKWQGAEATAYVAVKQYPQAIQIYRSLVASDALNSQQWLWAMATTQRDANQLKEAIGTFRQCENFPENYRQMAGCHRALKEYKEALILYGQIIGGSESMAPWAQLQIGYTYEQMDSAEQAIKAFQQCCKKYPKASYASTAHAHLQNKYKISVTLGGGTDE